METESLQVFLREGAARLSLLAAHSNDALLLARLCLPHVAYVGFVHLRLVREQADKAVEKEEAEDGESANTRHSQKHWLSGRVVNITLMTHGFLLKVERSFSNF